MKAVILNAIGEPMAAEEIPTPEPRTGEVMIRVEACGVCHTDLHVVKAEVKFPTPCVLGHEVSGTVVAHGPGLSGPDAERLAVGQRVVGAFIMPCGTCYYCVRGQDGLCETFFIVNRLGGKLYDGDTRLRHQAIKDGMRPLRMAGAMKVAQGVTTLDEVLSATPAWE